MKRRKGGAATDTESHRDPTNKWIIPATDEHGHSVTMQFRCTSWLAKTIGLLASGRRFPWRDKSEVLRYLVSKGIDTLQAEFPDETRETVTTWSRANLIHDLCATVLEHQQFARVIESLQQMTVILADAPREQQARLVEVRHLIAEMEEGHWKRKYEARFNELYGRYLEGVDWEAQKGSAQPPAPPLPAPPKRKKIRLVAD